MTKSNKKKGIESVVKVKARHYTTRVKTPTQFGFEVLINKHHITVSTMTDVRFTYRADGYNYQFNSHRFVTFNHN
jgi:hypothetical protein